MGSEMCSHTRDPKHRVAARQEVAVLPTTAPVSAPRAKRTMAPMRAALRPKNAASAAAAILDVVMGSRSSWPCRETVGWALGRRRRSSPAGGRGGTFPLTGTCASTCTLLGVDGPGSTARDCAGLAPDPDLPGWPIVTSAPAVAARSPADGYTLNTVSLSFAVAPSLEGKLGYDPVWFGVLIVLVVQVGLISPPVGMNMFVMNALLKNVPMSQIFRGSAIFCLPLVVGLALVLVFPQLALWLPGFMK